MTEPILLFGVPFDFVLFATTLLGVALFHRHTLPIALGGLLATTTYKLGITGFKDGAGLAGLFIHLSHEEFQTTAQTIGQPVVIIKVDGDADIEAAFATAKDRAVSGVIVAAGSFQFRWTDKLISLAARYALPAIYAGREVVSAGGLVSYSGSQSEAHGGHLLWAYPEGG